MKTKLEHLGTFVILINNNKVLLGKRKNSYKSGSYGLPGGRLELTEPLIECARRELFEETGVEATHLEYLGAVREQQDEYNFIHFGFVCRQHKGKIKVMEKDKCEGWQFFTTNEIPMNTLPAHKAGIELLDKKSNGYIDLLN